MDSHSFAGCLQDCRPDVFLAHSYFNSLATVLQQDAGNLWGVDLYAPTFFTDPETKSFMPTGPTMKACWNRLGRSGQDNSPNR